MSPSKSAHVSSVYSLTVGIRLARITGCEVKYLRRKRANIMPSLAQIASRVNIPRIYWVMDWRQTPWRQHRCQTLYGKTRDDGRETNHQSGIQHPRRERNSNTPTRKFKRFSRVKRLPVFIWSQNLRGWDANGRFTKARHFKSIGSDLGRINESLLCASASYSAPWVPSTYLYSLEIFVIMVT